MEHKTLASFFKDAKQQDVYWVEKAKFDFSQDIIRLLKSNGLSNQEYAERLNVKAPYVSKMLRGDENFTIQTMVKLVRALGAKLNIHVSDEDHHVRWFDVITTKAARKATQIEHAERNRAVNEWSKRVQYATPRRDESSVKEYEEKSTAA